MKGMFYDVTGRQWFMFLDPKKPQKIKIIDSSDYSIW